VHAIFPAAHAPRRWLPHRCSEMPFDVIAASSWRTASTSRERRTKHGHLEFADRHTDKGSFRRARRLQRRGGDSCTDDPKPFLEELATDSARSLNVYRVSNLACSQRRRSRSERATRVTMVWVENAYIPPTARPIQQRPTSWDLFRFPPKNRCYTQKSFPTLIWDSPGSPAT